MFSVYGGAALPLPLKAARGDILAAA